MIKSPEIDPCTRLSVNNDHYAAVVKTPNDNEDFEGGALRAGGIPRVWTRDYVGLPVQYAGIGLLYAAMPTVIYPFMQNYLNMEGMYLLSAKVLVVLPWTFGVFFGIASDCIPIFGYRRRPFMLLGWTISFVALIVMACMHNTKPYYPATMYRDADESKLSAAILAEFNLNAPNEGDKYVLWMMLVSVGYVAANSASDAIICEIAQREPQAVRGKTQTTIYIIRSAFMIIANILVGLLMNGEDYGGSFNFSLSFPQLMMILAILIIPVFPMTWFFIKEDKHEGLVFKTYLIAFWIVVQKRPVCQFMAFKFFAGIFENFSITVSDPIESYWAKVMPLNDTLCTIGSYVLFIIILSLISKCGLHWNWRTMHATTLIVVTAIDALVMFLTTWNIVRNQYFYVLASLVENLEGRMFFIITTFVSVELAGEGNEGAVYGLLTAVTNMAAKFASTITKNVDTQFTVGTKAIKQDTHEVRMQVTYILLISFVLNLMGLFFLPLLPRQKAEAQALKRDGGQSKLMGAFTVFYLVFANFWTVLINILSIFPSTKCLKIVGGTGC